MFAGKRSFARTRRRTAMWLVAAWLVFSVSQVFAACCLPAASAFDISTQAVSASQHQDEAAVDDCCDTAERACQSALDGAPPAAPVAGLVAPGQFQPLDGPPVQLALRPRAAALADGPARVPISQAPPAQIYLRLQRFLI